MWSYDKRLQFPVKIKNPDPQTAKIVITQLGGPNGTRCYSERRRPPCGRRLSLFFCPNLPQKVEIRRRLCYTNKRIPLREDCL